MKLSYLITLGAIAIVCGCKDEVEVVTVPAPDPIEEPPVERVDDGVMRNISSMELTAEMGSGWNLGNTLDTESEDETLWGNPFTTKAMIDAVSERGFTTIRVPVTWRFHMGSAPDYLVEPAWLSRVEEIVNYARANEMYVIINTHHDDPWIIPTYDQADEVKDRLEKLWTQIANRFKDYSDYVIFETLNEPRYEGTPEEWTGGTVEGRDVVSQYHQVSVDAIRATGGNNTTRHLMVSSYAASTTPQALDALVIPNDDERVIVSLHSYFPFAFCLGGTDTTWGTDEDKRQLDAELDKIYDRFVANGRAVVLGEWSSGNLDNNADRLRHATYYANASAERGFVPIWWDRGFYGVDREGSGLMDRNTLAWPFGDIADAVVAATR